MKKTLFYVFLLVGFSVKAQRILVPQDFIAAVVNDSCVLVGSMNAGFEVQLKYNQKTFYVSAIPATSSYFKISNIKDSLFHHVPESFAYWEDRKALPPGSFDLMVINEGKIVVSRNQFVKPLSTQIEISYHLDSFTLSSSILNEGAVIHLGIFPFLGHDALYRDTLTRISGRSFAYSFFKKNHPFVLKYQLVHESGIILSDTVEQRFIPNRSVRHDSVKKVFKQKMVLLKKEAAAMDLGRLDSLKTPTFSNRLIQPPNGSVGIAYGTFRGQNPRFPPSNFFQAQGYGSLSVLGIPVIAQAYVFDNGIEEHNRRDLKLSFDYQSLIADLEAKKNALKDFELDTSAIPSLKNTRSDLSAKLPDTAHYANILRAKRDSLLQITSIEKRLVDSIDTYKARMVDSLVSDSLNEVQAKYQGKISAVQDSIAQLKKEAELLETRIESAKKLKKQYETGIPTDSLFQANLDNLQDRALDSAHQYLDIDRFLAEKDFLSKHEEQYRKARAVYEKLKDIRSFDIGVITPYLSPFSLSGVPLKGVSTSYMFRGQNVGFNGGQMIQSPFFVQPLFNVLAVSDGFDLLDLGSLKVSSSNFWMKKDFQSISEVKLSSSAWKGWKSEMHFANSINQNYFSDEHEQYPFINKGNTSILSRLSKSFGEGLHSIEGQYKYVPASYFSPGNPFLINDIKAGTFRLNNSFFKRSLTSFVEIEFNRNNTLNQLTETTQRINFFSFQQLDISESLQFSALSSYLLSDGLFKQRFRMHDLNLLYHQDFSGTRLNTSAGFMYQEFTTGESLNNQTSLIKGSVSLAKKGNGLSLSFYQSVPIGESIRLTTATGSIKKAFFNGQLKSELRGGVNTVEHMNPRLTYGSLVSLQLYKGMALTLEYQGNSLIVNQNNFYANSSMGFVRISSTF